MDLDRSVKRNLSEQFRRTLSDQSSCLFEKKIIVQKAHAKWRVGVPAASAVEVGVGGGGSFHKAVRPKMQNRFRSTWLLPQWYFFCLLSFRERESTLCCFCFLVPFTNFNQMKLCFSAHAVFCFPWHFTGSKTGQCFPVNEQLLPVCLVENMYFVFLNLLFSFPEIDWCCHWTLEPKMFCRVPCSLFKHNSNLKSREIVCWGDGHWSVLESACLSRGIRYGSQGKCCRRWNFGWAKSAW